MKNICIIGPSGTGKTTIAKYIASRYRMEYITGSSRELSGRFDINSHQDIIKLCANDPDKAISFYKSILSHREDIMDNNPYHIVTDRGIIDLMVYFTMQLAPFMGIFEVEKFMQACTDILGTDLNKQIFIFTPYTFKHAIKEEDRRIVNQEYQAIISHAFDVFIKKYMPKAEVIIMDEWNWEERVKLIDGIFDDTTFNQFKSKVKRWLRKLRKQ